MSRWLLTLYRRSLVFYPRAFRDAYADPMLQTLADMLDDQPSAFAKAHVWLRVVVDMQRTVLMQHIQSKGEMLMKTVNKLITSAAWITVVLLGALLLPVLRTIGTTWTDLPGFLRVLALLLFIVMFIALPTAMAVLALFGYPRSVYKRLAVK